MGVAVPGQSGQFRGHSTYLRLRLRPGCRAAAGSSARTARRRTSAAGGVAWAIPPAKHHPAVWVGAPAPVPGCPPDRKERGGSGRMRPPPPVSLFELYIGRGPTPIGPWSTTNRIQHFGAKSRNFAKRHGLNRGERRERKRRMGEKRLKRQAKKLKVQGSKPARLWGFNCRTKAEFHRWKACPRPYGRGSNCPAVSVSRPILPLRSLRSPRLESFTLHFTLCLCTIACCKKATLCTLRYAYTL